MARSVTCSPIQNPSGDASSAFGCPSGVLNNLVTVALRTGGGGADDRDGVRTSPGASGRPRPCPKADAALVVRPAVMSARKSLRAVRNASPCGCGSKLLQ